MHGSTNYINYCAEVPTPVTIVKEPYTTTKFVHKRIESFGDVITIPGGMHRVVVRNMGPIDGSNVLEKITVIHGANDPFDIEIDGQHEFLHEYIDATCEQVEIEEIKIITNGSMTWIDCYEKI